MERSISALISTFPINRLSHYIPTPTTSFQQLSAPTPTIYPQKKQLNQSTPFQKISLSAHTHTHRQKRPSHFPSRHAADRHNSSRAWRSSNRSFSLSLSRRARNTHTHTSEQRTRVSESLSERWFSAGRSAEHAAVARRVVRATEQVSSLSSPGVVLLIYGYTYI